MPNARDEIRDLKKEEQELIDEPGFSQGDADRQTEINQKIDEIADREGLDPDEIEVSSSSAAAEASSGSSSSQGSGSESSDQSSQESGQETVTRDEVRDRIDELEQQEEELASKDNFSQGDADRQSRINQRIDSLQEALKENPRTVQSSTKDWETGAVLKSDVAQDLDEFQQKVEDSSRFDASDVDVQKTGDSVRFSVSDSAIEREQDIQEFEETLQEVDADRTAERKKIDTKKDSGLPGALGEGFTRVDNYLTESARDSVSKIQESAQDLRSGTENLDPSGFNPVSMTARAGAGIESFVAEASQAGTGGFSWEDARSVSEERVRELQGDLGEASAPFTRPVQTANLLFTSTGRTATSNFASDEGQIGEDVDASNVIQFGAATAGSARKDPTSFSLTGLALGAPAERSVSTAVRGARDVDAVDALNTARRRGDPRTGLGREPRPGEPTPDPVFQQITDFARGDLGTRRMTPAELRNRDVVQGENLPDNPTAVPTTEVTRTDKVVDLVSGSRKGQLQLQLERPRSRSQADQIDTEGRDLDGATDVTTPEDRRSIDFEDRNRNNLEDVNRRRPENRPRSDLDDSLRSGSSQILPAASDVTADTGQGTVQDQPQDFDVPQDQEIFQDNPEDFDRPQEVNQPQDRDQFERSPGFSRRSDPDRTVRDSDRPRLSRSRSPDLGRPDEENDDNRIFGSGSEGSSNPGQFAPSLEGLAFGLESDVEQGSNPTLTGLEARGVPTRDDESGNDGGPSIL